MANKIIDILKNNFNQYITTIHDASFDPDNNEYVSNLNNQCLGYDDMIKDYYKGTEIICSADVVWIKQDKIIFIEFKNGEKIDRHQIKLKGIEGGYIGLFDLVRKIDNTITFDDVVSLPKSYAVVYNVSNKRKIHAHISAKFGLKKYENIFFEKVATYDSDRFDILAKNTKFI